VNTTRIKRKQNVNFFKGLKFGAQYFEDQIQLFGKAENDFKKYWQLHFKMVLRRYMNQFLFYLFYGLGL